MPSNFTDLGVPAPICGALARRGITEPFEIQAATIADAIAGRDVCGRAPTGSGKTLAFGIPLVATVDTGRPREPRALILAPTRELAAQIGGELRSFSGRTRIHVVHGGVGYGPQISALRKGVDILVACPGRLEDLVDRGAVRLAGVDQVVIDEADRMADMGFLPAVRRLLDQTAASRQTMLFSATLDGDVAKLTRDYQRDPVRLEVGEAAPDIARAEHLFWTAARTERTDISAEVIGVVSPTLVFCRTRHGSDRLARQLSKRGINAVAIHGGRNQNQRTRALADFASGRAQALVATDVAARGIHVDGVASVIHYDLPADHKAYIHRSGRTARAGQGGLVVSLVQPEQAKDLRAMQRHIGLDRPATAVDLGALGSASAPADGRDGGSDRQSRRSRRPPGKTRRRKHGKRAGPNQQQPTNRKRSQRPKHRRRSGGPRKTKSR